MNARGPAGFGRASPAGRSHALPALGVLALLVACGPTMTSDESGGSPDPSPFAPDALAATLPREAAGLTFEVDEAEEGSLMPFPWVADVVEALAEDADEPRTLRMASATSDDFSTFVFALRVDGARAAPMVDRLVDVLTGGAPAGPGVTVASEEIDGRAVRVLRASEPPPPSATALYAVGEVLYLILTSDGDPDATVAGIVSLLP